MILISVKYPSMMSESIVHIKNMVCPRCIRVVSEELSKAGFEVVSVGLGTAVLGETNPDKKTLIKVLRENGFELLEEKSARLINEIKLFIIDYIRNGRIEDEKLKLSSLLEEHFKKDYNQLSQVFSASENITLEKFAIAQKIEQVKEWLVYDELTLSEMAWKLGYKNGNYLSSQFKQITGFSPTEFKKLKDHKRRALDSI